MAQKPSADGEESADNERFRCDPEYNTLPVAEPPEELKTMFQILREQSIITIEGKSCCGSCAANAAADHADQLDEDGAPVRGYAVYHEQALAVDSEKGRLRTEEYRSFGVESIYVGFSGYEDVPDAAVAGIIGYAATEAGLEWDWNGDTGTCVEVKLR